MSGSGDSGGVRRRGSPHVQAHVGSSCVTCVFSSAFPTANKACCCDLHETASAGCGYLVALIVRGCVSLKSACFSGFRLLCVEGVGFRVLAYTAQLGRVGGSP